MLKLLVVSLALASSSPPATAGKTQDTSKTEPAEALVVDERRRLSPSQIQKLTASDAAVADQFGHSVGISRDWLIVVAAWIRVVAAAPRAAQG